MLVHIVKDIPIRNSSRTSVRLGVQGTWVEAGWYEVLRDLGDKLLIVLSDRGWNKRLLTCIRYNEVEGEWQHGRKV